MTERTIATAIHGRYLIAPAGVSGPAPLLVGFHGYAEDAETQLERLRAIPDTAHWLKVSVQGLHCFYQRRSENVVAGWMTRQHRELAIADNLAYVGACLDAVAIEYPVADTLVFAGFSQGVAMAFRAAVNQTRPVTGVVSVGGDVPPEIPSPTLNRVHAALLVRGISDAWYTEEKFAEDERRLLEAGVVAYKLEFHGGHEWSPEVGEEVSRFLRERVPA